MKGDKSISLFKDVLRQQPNVIIGPNWDSG